MSDWINNFKLSYSSTNGNWSFSPYARRKHQRHLAPLPEAIVISAVQQKHTTPTDDDEGNRHLCITLIRKQ